MCIKCLSSFRFSLYFSLFAVLLFFSRCSKESTTTSTDAITAHHQVDSTLVEDRASCTIKIKINSVSPVSSGWVLAVRNSNTGNTYFYTSSVSSSCNWGNPVNSILNKWYTFSVPQGTPIKVDLGLLLNNGTCVPAPMGSTLSYSISGSPLPYPEPSFFTSTLVWGSNSLVFDDGYVINNSCGVIKPEVE